MASSLEPGKWVIFWRRGLLVDTVNDTPRQIHQVADKIVYFKDGQHPFKLHESKIIGAFDDEGVAKDTVRRAIIVWNQLTHWVDHQEKELDDAKQKRRNDTVRIIQNAEF